MAISETNVSEWEVIHPGGSAHILQNDRYSVQRAKAVPAPSDDRASVN